MGRRSPAGKGRGSRRKSAGRRRTARSSAPAKKGRGCGAQEQHGDFNLRLEYKLKAGGNSGVYIRVPENGDHHGDGAGIEIQVLDDKPGGTASSSRINTRAACTRSPRRRSTWAVKSASGTRWRSTASARSTM